MLHVDQEIADNPDQPTLENTIVAMERSGRTLSRVRGTFSILTGANTDPALEKLEVVICLKLFAETST